MGYTIEGIDVSRIGISLEDVESAIAVLTAADMPPAQAADEVLAVLHRLEARSDEAAETLAMLGVA